MASHGLIDAYVARLARRLPADTVDELADGLTETWRRHVTEGLAPDRAARAAIAEFGAADRVADEFVRQAPGRRTARLLLASGPVMAACWSAGLVTAQAWTWPIKPPIALGFGLALLIVALALLAAATSRHSYRRTHLGIVGALALVVLDAVAVVAVAIVAPPFVWPLAVAIPASLARIGLTLRALPPRALVQADT
jgi:hypothetical protein